MNLSSQVSSLELSRRLKELNVRQDSLFRWVRGRMEYGYEGEWHINETEKDEYFIFTEIVGYKIDGNDLRPNTIDISENYEKWEKEQKTGKRRMKKTIFSAYTTGELGEMLPARLEYNRPEHPVYRFAMEKQDTRWNVVYVCGDCGGRNFEPMLADTEANARAAMLIFLIENDLISKTNAAVFGGKEI